ncbi:DUF2497 domain-containing protein [Asticcacaulis sp. ZE23SCel15]|uniref:DUF2497 domain-containing protein n=1 Tax=Asticcacaulis sp. ZE23SCel15 TaxID=3059027 RepID=UPI00265EB11A|nr:DUF2497 domain-containing protein [Asticcacaulis sp. ZE23SCel15]WKL56836.1 DUF2497 domain-containing protein [Asticcacaulis sp. ZE23SCel15]
MSDQSAHEPTMEEILASIRRIISEDDAPEEAAEAPAEVAVAEPEPAPEPEPEPMAAFEEDEPEDDVLELTEPYVAAPVASIGDLDAYEPAVAPAPKPEPKPVFSAPEPDFGASRLVSDRTESTAANAFGALTNALLVPKDGRTLEDVLKELMRPMLQDWLDKNLASIVEEQVRLEVERIARQARR